MEKAPEKYLRSRVKSFLFETKNSIQAQEYDLVMPNNALVIVGVRVNLIAGVKTGMYSGIVNLSAENINGSFFTHLLVDRTSNSSGAVNSVGSTGSLPRQSAEFELYVPLKFGKRIKVVFENLNHLSYSIQPSKLSVQFRYFEKELEVQHD